MQHEPPISGATAAPCPHRRARPAEHKHPLATAATTKPPVHPTAAPLQSGWTPEAQTGIVTHGGSVLRCARHEGPGLITRTFTFSDPSFYVVAALDRDDDARRSASGEFVTTKRSVARADRRACSFAYASS